LGWGFAPCLPDPEILNLYDAVAGSGPIAVQTGVRYARSGFAAA